MEIRFLSPGESCATSYTASTNGKLRHPLFAFIGLRPIAAQHSRAEHEALRQWAKGRRSVVEIGVAEGASATALRQGMAADGIIYLIDPFHLSRFRPLNFVKRAAQRAVASYPRGQAVWIEAFSCEAARSWQRDIDLLFVDGDHRESAVERDWQEWSSHVVSGGLVIFHDARIFAGGWTLKEHGPVRLVDRLFRRDRIPGWKIMGEVDSLVTVQRTDDAPGNSAMKAASL